MSSSEEKKVKDVFEEIAEETKPLGVISPRGKGKSWALTSIIEIARLAGWHAIIFDTKGDDILLDTPAMGWQATVLSARTGGKVKPKGWNVEFTTFNFPYGLRKGIPLKYRLDPIAVKQIGFAHLSYMSEILTQTDVRLLTNAYLRAGGPLATVDDMLAYLFMRVKGKRMPSDALIAMMTCGFFADESPLEPENLFPRIEENKIDFVVIGPNWFKTNVRPLAYLATVMVMDSITDYLSESSIPQQIIWVFRELGVVGPRRAPRGAKWLFARSVESIIQQARQSFLSVTKPYWEAQAIGDVSPPVLENTPMYLIHPMALKSKGQRRRLEDYIPISEEIVSRVEPMHDPGPGCFFFLREDGTWEYIARFPPPKSLRVRELSRVRREEAKRVSKLVSKLLPQRDLEPVLRDAIAKMLNAMDMTQQYERIYAERFDMTVTVFSPKDISRVLADFLVALRYGVKYNDARPVLVTRRALSSWAFNISGRKTSVAMSFGPAKLEPKVNSKRPLLNSMGISIGKDSSGDLVFKVYPDKFLPAFDQLRNIILEKTKIPLSKLKIDESG